MTDDLLTPLSTAFEELALPAHAKLYLACSGGRDSLALAYACLMLYRQGMIKTLPTLLHVHHGWQAANDTWAQLVERWSDEHGFECQVLKVNLPKNSETHAREARYHAFGKVMNQGDVLMFAHHAHDQAETVLMRLVSGAGLQGLSGMKAWQAKTVCTDETTKTITLWRPWLTISRDKISQFAKAHALPYVDDVTNTDPVYARGRIRQDILPHLLALNPKAIENIGRSADLLSTASAMVDQQMEILLASLAHPANQTPYQRVLAIQDFFNLSEPEQTLALHRWLQGDEPLPPSHQLSRQVIEMIYRQDNDHSSQLLWQAARSAYVLCRYDDCLYRYRADVWQLFDTHMTEALADDHGWVLADDGRCQLRLMADISHIQKITKNESLIIGKHHYKGKKLAQKLRLPPWLRAHLWRVTVDDRQYLIAPMMAWDLSSSQRLDNFAPIGRMVYNAFDSH
ncbi:tRNA lysidine(34) synthetase TilS [Moraxella canis]|uniref:tRNA(Ile)-lysidine synthase n=1 Tax=Moraxella canis TaxID=90239 RepID=A0ABZ0WZI9_9GAMM|nr:tRNA lysidine(34) synthetase TilS [Moraxella canis]WQE04666.1 tRNA lysidine(34) synthetase TilS [Moraxella canis]